MANDAYKMHLQFKADVAGEGEIDDFSNRVHSLAESVKAARKDLAQGLWFKDSDKIEKSALALAGATRQLRNLQEIAKSSAQAISKSLVIPKEAVSNLAALKGAFNTARSGADALNEEMLSTEQGTQRYRDLKTELGLVTERLKQMTQVQRAADQEMKESREEAAASAIRMANSMVARSRTYGSLSPGDLAAGRQTAQTLSRQRDFYSNQVFLHTAKNAPSVPTVEYGAAQQKVKDLDKAIRELNVTLQKNEKASNNAGKSTKHLGSMLHSTTRQSAIALSSSVALAAARAGLAAATAAAGIQALKAAAAYEQQETAFQSLLGSQQKGQRLLADLNKFAADTQYTFDDLTTSTRRLLAYGFSENNALPMLRNIGDAVAALGGGSDMLNRVITALGQISTKGKVASQEMLQLTEAGIPAWELLAKKLGVSTDKLMKMVHDKQVTAAQAITAILEGINERFGGMMDRQSRTILGRFTTLSDNVQILMREMGEGIVEALSLKDAVGGLLIEVKAFADLVKRVGIRDAIEYHFDPRAVNLLKVALSAVGVLIAGKVLHAVHGLLLALGNVYGWFGKINQALRINAATLNASGVEMGKVGGNLAKMGAGLQAFGALLGRAVVGFAVLAAAAWVAIKIYDMIQRKISGVTKAMEEEMRATKEIAEGRYKAYTAAQKNYEAQAAHLDQVKQAAITYLELKKGTDKSAQAAGELLRATNMLNGEMQGLTGILDKMPTSMTNAERASKALKTHFDKLAESRKQLAIMELEYQAAVAQSELVQARIMATKAARQSYKVKESISAREADKKALRDQVIEEERWRIVEAQNPPAGMATISAYNKAKKQAEARADDILVTDPRMKAINKSITRLEEFGAPDHLVKTIAALEAMIPVLNQNILNIRKYGLPTEAGVVIPTVPGDPEDGKSKKLTPREQAQKIIDDARLAMRLVESQLGEELKRILAKAPQDEHAMYTSYYAERVKEQRVALAESMKSGLWDLTKRTGEDALPAKLMENNGEFMRKANAMIGQFAGLSDAINKKVFDEASKKLFEETMRKLKFTEDITAQIRALTDRMDAIGLTAYDKQKEEYQKLFKEREELITKTAMLQYEKIKTNTELQQKADELTLHSERQKLQIAAKNLRYAQQEEEAAKKANAEIAEYVKKQQVGAEAARAFAKAVEDAQRGTFDAANKMREAITSTAESGMDVSTGVFGQRVGAFDIRRDTVAGVAKAARTEIVSALGEAFSAEYSLMVDSALATLETRLREKVAENVVALAGQTFSALGEGIGFDADGQKVLLPANRSLDDTITYLEQQRTLWGQIAAQVTDVTKRDVIVAQLNKAMLDGAEDLLSARVADLQVAREMGLVENASVRQSLPALLALMKKYGATTAQIAQGQSKIDESAKTAIGERLAATQRLVGADAITVGQAREYLDALARENALLIQNLDTVKQGNAILSARVALLDTEYQQMLKRIKAEADLLDAQGKTTAEAKLHTRARNLGAEAAHIENLKAAIRAQEALPAATDDETKTARAELLKQLHAQLAAAEAQYQISDAALTTEKQLYQDKNALLKEQWTLLGIINTELDVDEAVRGYTEWARSVNDLADALRRVQEEFEKKTGIAGANFMGMTDAEFDALPQEAKDIAVRGLDLQNKMKAAKRPASSAEALRTIAETSVYSASMTTAEREKALKAFALDTARADALAKEAVMQAVLKKAGKQEATVGDILGMSAEQRAALLEGLPKEAMDAVNAALAANLDYMKLSVEKAMDELPSFAEAIFDYGKDRSAIKNYFQKVADDMGKTALKDVWGQLTAKRGKDGKGPSVMDELATAVGGVFSMDGDKFGKRFGKAVKMYGVISSGLHTSRSAGTAAASSGASRSSAARQGMMSGAMSGLSVASMLGAGPMGMIAGALGGLLFGRSEARKAYDRERARIEREQLDELKKINNKLTPVSDYYRRGGYGAITRSSQFGVSMEYAYAVSAQRGFR